MPLQRFDRPQDAYAAGYVYMGNVAMTLQPGETMDQAEERLARTFDVTPGACTRNRAAEGGDYILHFYCKKGPNEWRPPPSGVGDLRHHGR